MVKFIGEQPKKAHTGDFALDLVAKQSEFIKTKFGTYQMKYTIDLKTECLSLYGFKIIPRSGIVKTRLRLANSTGLIDSSYRGNWIVVFDIIGKLSKSEIEKLEKGKEVEGIYNVGDRIAQTYMSRVINDEWKQVKTLSDTDRGEGGFNSTGNK